MLPLTISRKLAPFASSPVVNIGVKEIERLIRKLELDKEILADAEIDDSDIKQELRQ